MTKRATWLPFFLYIKLNQKKSMKKKQNRPRMPNWFSRDDAHFFRKNFTEQEFKEFKKQKKC